MEGPCGGKHADVFQQCWAKTVLEKEKQEE